MQWVLFAVGVVVGAVGGWLIARLRLGERLVLERSRLRAEQEKLQWVEDARAALRETFSSLAGEALAANAERFMERARDQLGQLATRLEGDLGTHTEKVRAVVGPLEKALTELDAQVRTLEQRREGAYRGLEEHLRSLGEAQSRLRDSTLKLEGAMRSSTSRGRWGELQLRRVVELSGMQKHIDFAEQAAGDSGRPDMVVRLPNGGSLPVDAKTPAAAYLAAVEADGETRARRFDEHAKALRQRIQDLSRKQYWSQFDPAPEAVIMFVPLESALSAAFEVDPELFEYGVTQRVLIASPVTLLALLRAAAFGWQQFRIAENAREIAQQGGELYERLLNVLRPVVDMGTQLARTVDQYNKGVASLESRLLPALRRFRDLAAQSEELPDLPPVDREPRQLSLHETDGDGSTPPSS
jgi:DNA recombination protein RmuC